MLEVTYSLLRPTAKMKILYDYLCVWNAINAFIHHFSLKKNDFSLKKNHFSSKKNHFSLKRIHFSLKKLDTIFL